MLFRSSSILDRFWNRFKCFFKVASRELLDSEREGPNLSSSWQAQHFQGFADFAEKAKIDEASLRRCFANELHEENSIFPLSNATWRRFWSPRRAPGRSRPPFLASWVALGDSPGTPRGRRGRSGTLPSRSGDAFRRLLHATGSPERVQAAILSRF